MDTNIQANIQANTQSITVKVAIITKNKYKFTRLEEFIVPLLYKPISLETRRQLKKELNDYLWSEIKAYVTFIDINATDLMTGICTEMTKCFVNHKIDEFFYHTEGSYAFPKKFIELIYCKPLWPEYTHTQTENMNTLGCLFSLKHTIIENTCAIIANTYDIASPHFVKITSVTRDDILRVIRRRFYFSAALITDNDIIKYYYQSPTHLIKEIYGLTDSDKIEKLKFNHLGYNLIFYLRQDKNKYANKIATRINASYRLYGDVLVINEMEDNVNASLSLHELKRLNVLSYGRLYDRKIKDEENITTTTVELDDDGNEVNKKVTPLWSKFVLINERIKKWNNNKISCINCSKPCIQALVCKRCYRARYCSTKCEQDFREYHYDDCINPFTEITDNKTTN